MQRCRQVGMAVVTVLALTGALTIATTTAASATPPGLSSISAINTYLADNGITNAFWQTGLKNYAGPSCPGAGWNCHAANVPIVQFASLPGSTNLFLCLSPNCLVIQVAKAGGQNGGACLRGDGSENVVQVCEIDQLIDTGNPNSTNAAGIQQNSQQNQSAVTARQVARITQANGSGRNIAHIFQVIGQTSNVTGASDVVQSQEAHQAATVDQFTTTGNNSSNITQRQKQSQKATGGDSITQTQDTEPGTDLTDLVDFHCDQPGDQPPPPTDLGFDQHKNQCVEVVQTSNDIPDTDGGSQSSSLDQAINEQQNAKNTAMANQTQGETIFSSGGQGGEVVQHSSGVSTSQAPEDTVQVQSASGVTALSQKKDAGDPRCCMTQGSNPNNTARINQSVNQSAFEDGAFSDAAQRAVFVGTCASSGTCNVQQTDTTNGVTDTNGCTSTGAACGAFFFCTSGVEGGCFED
jgi:hypothetical protein